MNPRLTQIQAKIREVCPELECEDLGCHTPPRDCTNQNHWESLELSHVLRAIEAKERGNYFIDTEGWIVRNNRLLREQNRKIRWNLTKPLHLQDDSVIDFLFTILCHE